MSVFALEGGQHSPRCHCGSSSSQAGCTPPGCKGEPCWDRCPRLGRKGGGVRTERRVGEEKMILYLGGGVNC